MACHHASLVSGATLRFGSLDFIYVGLMESIVGAVFNRPEPLVAPPDVTGSSAFVLSITNDHLAAMLGPNPMQEHFRLITYSVSALAFQANGEESLA